MFCSTLRRRPSFSGIVPLLTAKQGFNLKENTLETHDVSLPLSNNPNAKYPLRLLLLGPSCASSSAISHTHSRIQHFAALTAGTNLAIVILLSSSASTTSYESASAQAPSVHAYMQLTIMLTSMVELPAIPVLPLPNLSGFESLLRRYLRVIDTSSQVDTRNFLYAPNAFELLPWCSTSPPMSYETVVGLTDFCTNLRELAYIVGSRQAPDEDGDMLMMGETSGDRQVLKRLQQHIGDDAVGVIEFWREEWVAD